MQIDFDFEKYGLDKFNHIYTPFLRYTMVVMFLIFLLISIITIILEGISFTKEDLWMISFLPFLILIGLGWIYIWKAKILINSNGFTKKVFKEKHFSWDDIIEIQGAYSHSGNTFIKLLNKNGKRIEISLPSPKFKTALEDLNIAIYRTKPNYNSNFPEFDHKQFTGIVNNIVTTLALSMLIGLKAFNSNILENFTLHISILFIILILSISISAAWITLGRIICNGNHIIITTLQRKRKFDWSEIDYIASVNKYQTLLIPHYSMVMNTKDGKVTVRTTNKETYEQFKKIRDVLNH